MIKGLTRIAVVAVILGTVLLGVAVPADDPSYPAPGMNTCTAAMVGFNFAAHNLNECLKIPGQNCWYETAAYQWALGQAMYWCYGAQS